MMSAFVATLLDTRLLAILRMTRYEHAAEAARALVAGGIQALEFTLSGAGALQAIESARRVLEPGIHVGAGTVLSPADVAAAAAAGAEFIVTPVVDERVIAACRVHGLPVVCGAFTPTEMRLAVEAGAELVKLFPARLGGPPYVRDVLAPFPDLRLVPTGGVSAENAAAYLQAGAVAVAIGGNLVPAREVSEGRFEEITRRATELVQLISRGIAPPKAGC